MRSAPHPTDIQVGQRLRQPRTLKGFSQERLGRLIGVTYQQVQKYERGTNRIGSSRLDEIARILGVQVGYFFEEQGESRRNGGKSPCRADPRSGAAQIQPRHARVAKQFRCQPLQHHPPAVQNVAALADLKALPRTLLDKQHRSAEGRQRPD